MGDVWKIQIAAPPVDGKANAALLKFLARLTRLPADAVRIVSGFTSALKTVEIEGTDTESLNRAILESHASEPNRSESNSGSA